MSSPQRDDAIDRLREALIMRGWMPPYLASVNDFTDEQIAAGELGAADREASDANRAALRDALLEADLLPSDLRD